MKKSVESYMEQGLDRKMAEYFASGKKRIVAVIPNDDFSLTITFDNGEKRCYDVTPFFTDEKVESLKNLLPQILFENAIEIHKRIQEHADSARSCVSDQQNFLL